MEQVQAIGLVLARPFCYLARRLSPGQSAQSSRRMFILLLVRAGVSVFKRHYGCGLVFCVPVYVHTFLVSLSSSLSFIESIGSTLRISDLQSLQLITKFIKFLGNSHQNWCIFQKFLSDLERVSRIASIFQKFQHFRKKNISLFSSVKVYCLVNFFRNNLIN